MMQTFFIIIIYPYENWCSRGVVDVQLVFQVETPRRRGYQPLFHSSNQCEAVPKLVQRCKIFYNKEKIIQDNHDKAVSVHRPIQLSLHHGDQYRDRMIVWSCTACGTINVCYPHRLSNNATEEMLSLYRLVQTTLLTSAAEYINSATGVLRVCFQISRNNTTNCAPKQVYK